MGMTEDEKPNYARLRRIQIVSVVAGAVTLGTSLYLMGQFAQPELVPIVIAIAFTAFVFSGVFYFGCLLFEGALQKYIIDDKTVIKGQTVEMQTSIAASGDPKIDEWVGRYVFARNTFGLAIIPLLLLGGVFLFS